MASSSLEIPANATTEAAKDLEKQDDNRQDGTNENAPKEHIYPPFRTVIVIMLALYLVMFLVSLDRIIISTAIPRITDEFQSLHDVGWYGSAYVLTSCAMQLMFGRLYSLFHNKTVFLANIVVFEAGSALCGAAPNSTAFILGRALAGIGSAGVTSGVIVLMISLLPLQKRPKYQGLLGAIFGVSSVLGPLIGGAFTNNRHLTWRWCFYINLPIGALSVALVLLFLHMPPPVLGNDASAGLPRSWTQKMLRLDPVGSVLFAAAVVSLVLAVQWGGTTYAWGSGRIVALLVVAGVLFVAWVIVEVVLPQKQNKRHALDADAPPSSSTSNAAVPWRVLGQRSILAGVTFCTCVGGITLTLTYYLAIWFQAIGGVDALQSGIRSLPFVLALVVASLVAGGCVSRLGYYTPFVIASACVMAVGSGLMTTLHPSSGRAAWIGFQVIAGFGMGLGMQTSGLAAQVVLARPDVPIGVSLMFVGQGLGGAVFLGAAQNVFLQSFVGALQRLGLFTSDRVQELANMGATDIRSAVSADQLPAVLEAYNHAITRSFYVPLVLACVSLLPALCLEWKSVKAKAAESGKADKADEMDKAGKAEAQRTESDEV